MMDQLNSIEAVVFLDMMGMSINMPPSIGIDDAEVDISMIELQCGQA